LIGTALAIQTNFTHLTIQLTNLLRRRNTLNPKELIAKCREKDVKAIDMRFMDFIGLWQHITIPVHALDEDKFEDGIGFDGSSIRGWQAIDESDMLLMPQPETALSVHTHSDDEHHL